MFDGDYQAFEDFRLALSYEDDEDTIVDCVDVIDAVELELLLVEDEAE